MAKQFEGKVVLITGSSNGIGRGMAIYFAAHGAKVTIAGSLTKEPLMSKLVQDTVEPFGSLDHLVKFPYYGMSKSVLDPLTRSLALELIPKGIRVNGVKPGAVSSEIMQRQGATQEILNRQG
ncbi:unnamed protein product, partial [Mesorhabditis spiculigera]